jgi:hypothetical protein
MRNAKPPTKVWLYPHAPTDWTPKIRLAIRQLGWRYGTREDHDLRVYFSNRTIDKDGVILDRRGRRKGPTTTILPTTINGGCTDVSKSRVEEVFKATFGYGSFIDPRKSDVVMKTEIQSIKDIAHRKACEPKPGYVAQRFIDTRHDGLFVDLRVAFAGAKIVTVAVKRKPLFRRATNAHILFTDPKFVFSSSEIQQLNSFGEAFGLDFGEADVLRDHDTGKLYVVDVNPTANADVEFPTIEKQLGRIARQLAEEQYAAFFKDAFDNETWRVR